MAQKDADRMEALMEDMSGKFDTMMEYVKDIPDIKKQNAVMFEEVGRLREDVTIVKTEISDILDRLKTVEKALELLGRHSDEIGDLRKRVEKLEKVAV